MLGIRALAGAGAGSATDNIGACYAAAIFSFPNAGRIVGADAIAFAHFAHTTAVAVGGAATVVGDAFPIDTAATAGAGAGGFTGARCRVFDTGATAIGVITLVVKPRLTRQFRRDAIHKVADIHAGAVFTEGAIGTGAAWRGRTTGGIIAIDPLTFAATWVDVGANVGAGGAFGYALAPALVGAKTVTATGGIAQAYAWVAGAASGAVAICLAGNTVVGGDAGAAAVAAGEVSFKTIGALDGRAHDGVAAVGLAAVLATTVLYKICALGAVGNHGSTFHHGAVVRGHTNPATGIGVTFHTKTRRAIDVRTGSVACRSTGGKNLGTAAIVTIFAAVVGHRAIWLWSDAGRIENRPIDMSTDDTIRFWRGDHGARHGGSLTAFVADGAVGVKTALTALAAGGIHRHFQDRTIPGVIDDGAMVGIFGAVLQRTIFVGFKAQCGAVTTDGVGVEANLAAGEE